MTAAIDPGAGPGGAALALAPQLRRRLLWFGRLRWIAVGGLALGSFVGPALGLAALWPHVFAIAVVVAAYNVVFDRLLRWKDGEGLSGRGLILTASLEMVMDLAALLAAAHYTGGLESPLLLFLAFHMVIGTILISNRWAYVLAGATSLGALALLLMEARGVLGFHPLHPGASLHASLGALNLGALVAASFGIVYLTASVVRELIRTTTGLSEAAAVLRERGRELHRVAAEMEDLERRKSHYMRISAHQLRSPLGTIRTTLEVLADGLVDPSSERGRRLLHGAVDRTDGLLATVNDLLDLAKVREGRRRAPWHRHVILNQLLADLLDTLEIPAQERGISLAPRFDGVAVLEWGVPPDLVHAFENLIENAIKYSHPGGRVTVRLSVENGRAIVRVDDQGIGIPPELVDQVFFEFVRAPNAKRHAPGTGLGLAIVREVVEAHGGTARADIPDGGGTSFRVDLPLDHAPAEADRSLQVGNEDGYPAHTPA